LTNNLKLAASTIAELYNARWNIEIFFRNLKHNFHIKSFVGTTRNAVEIQIWTALVTMLMLSYLKSIAHYTWHFSNLVHSLRLNTFTKIDLQLWLDSPFSPINDDADST
ncbi:MAG: transposase, partial [Bacteroidales bacterium]|nr:transposase [Bacteroidales bacterium]